MLNSREENCVDNGYCYIPVDYPVKEYWVMIDEFAANTTDFIGLVKDGAIDSYRKYGVLPSLAIAQAILESNWGRSAPGNMLFGIKWTEGCGYDSQLLWSWEYYKGEWVRVQAKFRKYDSYADSIEDHAQLFVRLSRYKPVLEAKNYIEACEQVQKCGYATDPEYSQKLISLIEKYNLNQWDREGYKMYNDFDKVSDWAKDAVEELEKLGIMKGDLDGNFRPKDSITREEMAVVINRVVKWR